MSAAIAPTPGVVRGGSAAVPSRVVSAVLQAGDRAEAVRTAVAERTDTPVQTAGMVRVVSYAAPGTTALIAPSTHVLPAPAPTTAAVVYVPRPGVATACVPAPVALHGGAGPWDARAGSLTRGFPDPASIEEQKRAHSRNLDAHLEEGTKSLRAQSEERRKHLREAAEQRKQALIQQVEQELKLQEVALDEQISQALLALRKSVLDQRAALEQQAAALVLEYQQRKMHEEFAATQVEMQRQFAELQARLQSEARKLLEEGEGQRDALRPDADRPSVPLLTRGLTALAPAVRLLPMAVATATSSGVPLVFGRGPATATPAVTTPVRRRLSPGAPRAAAGATPVGRSPPRGAGASCCVAPGPAGVAVTPMERSVRSASARMCASGPTPTGTPDGARWQRSVRSHSGACCAVPTPVGTPGSFAWRAVAAAPRRAPESPPP